MSRIGKKPVKIEDGAKVEIKDTTVTVVGPKGTLTLSLRPEISVKIEDGYVIFDIKPELGASRDSKGASAYLGMTRSLVNGMILGVTKGFEKKMELVGVGYRAKTNGNTLVLTVGYSNPVEFPLPAGITAEVVDNTNLTIRGFDKQLVGQVAANIRKVRKPEPYKGKGIKYAGEVIRRKQGKSGKV